MPVRLLRSALYVPGSNQRALDKARSIPCDALIFDLEDAVAPADKHTARRQVLQQVQAGGYGERQLVVRANGIDSPWGEGDLQALAAAAVATVCLPKVDSAAQLQHCVQRLRQFGAPPQLAVWAMIETPRGVAGVESICGACDELQVLLMGGTDLSHRLRTPPRADRLGLLYALSKCVNAARMHNRVILDSVFLNIEDSSALRAECEQGHALGFDGKTVIHPAQVETVNAVYGLSAQQIERARRLLAVWQQAQAVGRGVAVLDGELVESMHVEAAQRILALAE